jgi:hypothetical protein
MNAHQSNTTNVFRHLRAAFKYIAFCLVCTNAWAHSNKVIAGADAYFEFQKKDIASSSIDKLRHFVRVTERSVADVVIVVGHASKEERNPQVLSENRAKSVVQYLVNSGVAPNRIFFEGKSHSQTVSQTPLEIYKDRRVELEFVGLPQHDLRLHGFGFMSQWNESAPSLPWLEIDSPFEIYKTPIQFAQKIRNIELQQIFFLKLSLHYLIRKDETNLLSVAPLLNLCGSEADGLPNPYLYAVLWGSAASLKALQKCNSPINLTKEQRIDVFRRMFCLEMSRQVKVDFDATAEVLFEAHSLSKNIDEKAAGMLFTCSINADRAKWLVGKGIKIPTEPIDKWYLLSRAAFRSDIDLVRVLIDAGADVRARTAAGDTVLHHVGGGARARTSIGAIYPASLQVQKEIWSLLLSHGADPDAVNNRGQKPIAP